MKNGYDSIGASWLTVVARVFAGESIYLVGGAVRDPFLHRPVSDVDLCGAMRPERVLALCENSPVRAVVRSAEMGALELHVTDENGTDRMAEYTVFRRESYNGGHRPSRVEFADTPEQDAPRRDFSVNALYRPLLPGGPGEVIDPTGGLAHLRAGMLHTVTPDPDLVLQNDGLRILRGARFAAELGLIPTPSLRESMKRHAMLVKEISAEQCRGEWRRLLLADRKREKPVSASMTGLCLLRSAGILPLGLKWSMRGAAALSGPAREEALSFRMALLFSEHPPEIVAGAMERERWPGDEIRAVRELLLLYRSPAMSLADSARLGPERIGEAVRMARCLGDNDTAICLSDTAKRLRGKPLSPAELCVRGGDMVPIAKASGLPAAVIGKTLRRLWEKVLSGECENQKEELLASAGKIMRDFE